MKHRGATDYLPDYETGSLDPGTEVLLAAHVEGCSACRDWLDARDLLAEGVSRGWDRGADHPDSDLLALCVVRPEEVHEPDRDELHHHLQVCSLCREDLRLVREAVREARPAGTSSLAPLHLLNPSRLSRPLGLLAASVVVLLLGGGLFGLVGFLVHQMAPADDSRAGAPGANSRPAAWAGPVEELSGSDLDGTRIIAGDRRLLVSKLSVKRDADITFHAGEAVAFGDGFRVEAGGRIRVGSDSAVARTSRNPSVESERTDRKQPRE